MDMSAAEVKRAALAQPLSHTPSPTLIRQLRTPMGPKFMVRCLQAEGVKFMWGYPGGAVLYIYDALYKQETRFSMCWCAMSRPPSTPRMVTPAPPVRSAWRWSPRARASRMPSPASRPRTWTRSRWSSSPARCPQPAIGLDAFQECDTVGITRPIVKHNFLVKDVRDLATDAEEGLSHRPHRPPRSGGGRHPEGCVAQDLRRSHYPDHVEMRSYNPVKKGHGGQIRKASATAVERPSAPTSTPVVG